MAWQFSGSNLDLVTLALSMTTYTWGPMLGLLILSIIADRHHVAGIGKSVVASIMVVLLINEPELLNFMFATDFRGPVLAWPWLFLLSPLWVMLFGVFGIAPVITRTNGLTNRKMGQLKDPQQVVYCSVTQEFHATSTRYDSTRNPVQHHDDHWLDQKICGGVCVVQPIQLVHFDKQDNP